MRKAFASLAAAAALLAASAASVAADERAPVVVELFTSEGCSSCPPADAYLFELREREDVLALAFHVDYWDYLGWKDRFARRDFTQRQRAYARALGVSMVYTPQLVVDGADHVVGSNRSAVDEAIEAATRKPHPIEIELSWSESRALVISIPAVDYAVGATIWFVRYVEGGETQVTAGENAGRYLRHANIVDELAALGMWHGEAMSITLPWEAIAEGNGSHEFGCAIIVQPEGLGPILAAREIDWGEGEDW